MPRADWGGGADYSGIFAHLNEVWQNRVEAATNRAVRQAEEERAAADAEMHDKWKNGLITDDAWLDYIDTRVEDSKGDPKEFAEWTRIKREHETGIQDAQAETAFDEGKVSIHALIGYYRDRMRNVKSASPEYRELSQRLTDLTEQRDSDEIYDQAEAIIDRIERGNGSYGELLSFYKKALKKVNKNSSLHRQLKREINSIQDIVDGVNGRLGGGGGRGGGRSRSGRRSRGGRGSGDGAVSAEATSMINDMIVKHRRGGSLYDPTMPDPILQTSQYWNVESMDDMLIALESDRDRIMELVEYEKDNPSATQLVDMWGNTYPNTPEFRRALDDMMIRTLEQKWAIKFAEGDADDATKEMLRLSTYVSEHMQRHNSDNMRPAWNTMLDSALGAIQSAALTGDPKAQIQAYREANRHVTMFIENHTMDIEKKKVQNKAPGQEEKFYNKTTKTTKVREELPDDKLQQELMWAQTLFNGIANGSDGDGVHAELSAVIDARPEGFKLTKEELQNVALGRDGIMGVIDTYDAAQGLVDGTWAYFGDGALQRPVPMEELENLSREADQAGRRMVPTFDNGRLVYRMTEPADRGFTVWVDRDGVPISSITKESMTLEQLEAMKRSGDIEEVEWAPGWERVTMSDGKVWYVDPVTNLFYKQMPVRYQTDKTGRLEFDPITGQPVVAFEAFAHARGVAAPFAGTAPRRVQELLEEAVSMGLIDETRYFTRDEEGNAQFDNPTFTGMYFSESDKIAHEAAMKSMREAGGKWGVYQNWREREQQGAPKEGPPIPKNFFNTPKSRLRRSAEDLDDSFEKRMKMMQRAERDAWREEQRLSAEAPDPVPAQTVADFASKLGIRLPSTGLLEQDSRTVMDGLAREVAKPRSSLPPIRPKPPKSDLPKVQLPDSTANSREKLPSLAEDRVPTRAPRRRRRPPPPPPTGNRGTSGGARVI